MIIINYSTTAMRFGENEKAPSLVFKKPTYRSTSEMANRQIVGYGPRPLNPEELINALRQPGLDNEKLFRPQWHLAKD